MDEQQDGYSGMFYFMLIVGIIGVGLRDRGGRRRELVDG